MHDDVGHGLVDRQQQLAGSLRIEADELRGFLNEIANQLEAVQIGCDFEALGPRHGPGRRKSERLERTIQIAMDAEMLIEAQRFQDTAYRV